MKKFMSLLMAIVMVFCLATPVNAVNTEENPNLTKHTITITNTDGDDYVYEAYQVFSGDIADGKLTNITWGKGVKSADLLAALKNDDTLKSLFEKCTTAADVAKVVGTLTGEDNAAKLEKFADLVANYLTEVKATSGTPTATVVDEKTTKYSYAIEVYGDGYYFVKDQKDSVGEGEAYTKYILKVTNDVAVNAKSAVPTVDKQVQDEVDDKDVNSTDNQGWGETADHDINETFQFKLIATLPADVDFAAYDKYKVVFTDTMSEGITFEEIVSVKVDGVTFNKGENGWVCTPKEDEIKQTFKLTIANIKVEGVNLNDGAIIEVIYNAHLNENAMIANTPENKNTVYLEYSNNPNAGGEDDLGRTPEDHVWVFTYVVNGTKVDGAEKDKDGNYTKPLQDAEFVFYKEVKEVVDGEEKLVPYYVKLNANKVDGWTKTKSEASVIKTPANGTFTIIGLDAGTYYLEETVAPNGYNLLKDRKTVTITAAHKETSTTTAETLNGTSSPNVEVTVENFSGATLPETGGMGTTLFYVFGSLLAIGAIVLLVTKKRMNEE